MAGKIDRLTDEQRKQLVQRRIDGEQSMTLAYEFNISKRTVERIITQSGRRNEIIQTETYTNDERKLIEELLLSGESINDAAERFSKCARTLRRFASKEQIKRVMADVKCDYCFTEFSPKMKNERFCSKECADSYKRGYTFCEYCGVMFFKPVNGQRCCSRNCNWSLNAYEQMEHVYDGKIKLLNYTKSVYVVEAECTRCGLKFERQYFSLTRYKSGCPNCDSVKSKGEEEISEILNEYGVNFIREYSFADKSVRRFRYDFAIVDEQKNVKILIEYDGAQHFDAYEGFGGEEQFRRTQKNDKIKNEFAELKRIPLIRIPYTMKPKLREILSNIVE